MRRVTPARDAGTERAQNARQTSARTEAQHRTVERAELHNHYEQKSSTPTTMTSSRFVRPEHPASPIILMARDYAVFAALNDYRLLYARHLQALAFPGTSLRRVQARLRQLWEHRLLNRYFRPMVVDGTKPFTFEPAYGLGPGSEGLDIRSTILGAPREPSPMTFDHELIAADCLTAMIAACRERSDVALVSTTPATPLWRRAKSRAVSAPFLVPDGVITFRYPTGVTLTFYVEIVRADVKGGNDRLMRKMQEYVSLNREGRFRTLYGHDQLRAVLFLTTSHERADHFRKLAMTLPHGRRLFWFGSYQTTEPNGRAVTTLTPDSVLTPCWRTTEGDQISFLTP